MWIPEKPFDGESYDEAIKDISPFHHIKHKLLKLKDSINTETAQKMADERHRFMESFIQGFFDEWGGKK